MPTPDGPDDRTLDPSQDPPSDSAKANASPFDSGDTLHTSASYTPEQDPSFVSPGSIGPYRLVRKLGEGGMGQVWLAEQTAPLQRLVAIKLIRAGVSDNILLERFESERQSLARMNHPAIAKVFDAGATSDGTPYFVMEYVSGIPITLYCDQKRLAIRKRLELFLKVCEGVQHAHQKAILHRDLKPANILVTEIDGKPAPHIIDFGIAKAIGDRDASATMFTRAGNFIGTPVYMSPEQADPEIRDVDTRSDVYSLAVILYELLTGTLPFDPTKWSNEIRQEQVRKLYEQDPQPPSIQFRKKTTTEADTATQTAKLRSTEPQQLVSELKGDLDWITLKALERDRGRRYGTPSEFAADIQHFLNNEPVAARPASRAYRVQKYVRRHRLAVSIAAAALLVLVAFSVMQAIQLRRITKERDRANRIADFMTKMFKVSDPGQARGNSITAREVLDKASKDIDTGLAKDPGMQAQMMHTMGEVYYNLGLYKEAESLLRHAMDIRTRALGPASRDTLSSMSSLAQVLTDESQFDEAEKLSRASYQGARKSLGPGDPDTLLNGLSLSVLLLDRSRFPDCEAVLREMAANVDKVKDPELRSSIAQRIQTNFAIAYAYQGKFADAEKSFRVVYDLTLKKYGPDHPATFNAHANIANILLQQDKFAEAETIYQDVLERQRRVLGPEHPRTLLVMGNLGIVYLNQKRYSEAEPLYRQLVDLKTRVVGADNRQTLVVKAALADVLRMENKLPEAEKLSHEALDAERRVMGPDHSDTLVTQNCYGQVLLRERRYPEAESVLLDTLARRSKSLGAKHPDTAETEYTLAGLYALEGKREDAFLYLNRSLDDSPKPDLYNDLPQEADFSSLHSDPRFAEFVAKTKKGPQAPVK
ncbi:MAG TPA: serine/threonine-protein kinase [Candidatus Acidoferrum sp.]|nr:serine/threonine-protein kinase [Candidatus Acidoferrum sp.]